MPKQWLFNIISAILVVIVFVFWLYSYIKLKEELINVKADNVALTAQIKAKEEAAQIHKEEYNKIEEAYLNLNQQLEEMKDDESIHWLNATIPAGVDATIPY